jgi:hypothetical protein
MQIIFAGLKIERVHFAVEVPVNGERYVMVIVMRMWAKNIDNRKRTWIQKRRIQVTKKNPRK